MWDDYSGDLDAEEPSATPDLSGLPDEIRAIGEKRRDGAALTATERKRLERFRDGTYTGQRGRPRN